jgi:hypothetical protein
MTHIVPKTVWGSVLLILTVSGCGGRPQSVPKESPRSTQVAAVKAGPTVLAQPTRYVPASPTPRIITHRQAVTTTQPYVIRPDGVFLPGYDDRGSTAPPELLRLDATAFARTTHIFRERAICTKPTNETVAFTLPSRATQIGVAMRGVGVENEWPRIRLSLVDARTPARKVAVFEGNIAWRELRYVWADVPPDWRNRLVFLRLEMLNPNYYFSQRAVYVAWVVVRGAE